MNKQKARQIISENSLISRKLSKIILKNIRNDESYDDTLNLFISETNYYRIKKIYKEKLVYFKQNKIECSPRNLPFLYIIKDMDKNFEWKINHPSTISNSNVDLVTNGSNVQGLRPSFSSIIFSLVNKNLHKNLNYPEFLENNQEIKLMILELFEKVNFATNLAKVNVSLLECLEKAIENKYINILTPLCPDYANVDLGKGFYTLTFDGLGSDVGVTAKRLIENLEALHAVFKKRNIKVKHIAAIGDFEALSNDTCKRVNLTRDEFIEKLKISQDKLKIKVGKQLDTILFTELCHGLDNWSKIHKKFYEMLINHKFGNTNLNQDIIRIICESRKPLLYRWFGKISDEELLRVVLWQGAEYATMGHIAQNYLDNTLVIGADHFKMAPFYDLASTKLPVLYLTSNYIRN